MINLLPDEVKRDIRAARMNVFLLRYNIMAIGSLLILVIFCSIFFLILRQSQASANSTSSENSTKAASFSAVKNSIDEYKNNLSIASKILQNGISYTDVIIGLTKLVPKDVILDGLNLASTSFGQQTSFAAHAKTYEAATKLKENFQSSSLVSNVYFQALSTTGAASSGTDYPVAIIISAKLNLAGEK